MNRFTAPANPSALAATLIVALVVGVAPSRAGELTFQSPPGRATLLELYTSEGCSSCPPADAWVGRLKDSPRLWTSLVPVVFHVDYWDNLGWRDRFSTPAFTARQREHAARWGAGSVYTPGFVLDGREWRGWFKTAAGRGAAGGDILPDAPGGPAGALSATVAAGGRSVTVNFRPREAPTVADGTSRMASVALLGFGLRSDVRAGENRGRDLRHDFVALSCEQLPLRAVGDGAAGRVLEARFRLPAAPADAGRLAVAAWVTNVRDPGVPEQATGGWLELAGR